MTRNRVRYRRRLRGARTCTPATATAASYRNILDLRPLIRSLSDSLGPRKHVEVVRALSFEDGAAVVGSDASIQTVVLNWDLGADDEGSHSQAMALLEKLRERHGEVPVFLLAERKTATKTITIEVAEMVDEFVWIMEDSPDFVAGRIEAAIGRYRASLLPPYARALAEYSRLREHS